LQFECIGIAAAMVLCLNAGAEFIARAPCDAAATTKSDPVRVSEPIADAGISAD